ncbi:hypothetical protein OV079_52895 [Nannocystis pusilla]|uniref:Uncharacterized protein n=1 Tax=Nannocystis pusilla TaxID=889268 RepID=A0A9X3F402_9BACT|nr:hypothetical protein [Nannocystis pusilla]MCY1014079.1 hypothetical protein [Nannocystis pusilla]
MAADRAVLATSTASFEVDLKTGALPRWWPSAGLSLMTCLEGNVLYAAGWQFACYELARGRWCSGRCRPACRSCSRSCRRRRSDRDGDGAAAPARRARRLPGRAAGHAGARYLAARDKHGDGAVYRFDGELQLPLDLYSQHVPAMWPEGQLRDATEDESDRLDDTAWAETGLEALVLCEARDAWRRVQDGGVVEATTMLFRVPFAISAAAFDASGARCCSRARRSCGTSRSTPSRGSWRASICSRCGRCCWAPRAARGRGPTRSTRRCVATARWSEWATSTSPSGAAQHRVDVRRGEAARPAPRADLAAHAQGVKRARKLPRLYPPR